MSSGPRWTSGGYLRCFSFVPRSPGQGSRLSNLLCYCSSSHVLLDLASLVHGHWVSSLPWRAHTSTPLRQKMNANIQCMVYNFQTGAVRDTQMGFIGRSSQQAQTGLELGHLKTALLPKLKALSGLVSGIECVGLASERPWPGIKCLPITSSAAHQEGCQPHVRWMSNLSIVPWCQRL